MLGQREATVPLAPLTLIGVFVRGACGASRRSDCLERGRLTSMQASSRFGLLPRAEGPSGPAQAPTETLGKVHRAKSRLVTLWWSMSAATSSGPWPSANDFSWSGQCLLERMCGSNSCRRCLARALVSSAYGWLGCVSTNVRPAEVNAAPCDKGAEHRDGGASRGLRQGAVGSPCTSCGFAPAPRRGAESGFQGPIRR